MMQLEGCPGLWFALASENSESRFFILYVDIGHFVFRQRMFHPRSISLKCSAPFQTVCAQGMQINLMLALAKPS